MQPQQILIADDHAIVRKGLKIVIDELFPGCSCDEACNGDEIFFLIKKTNYDLLILDINMPFTDSVSLVTNLLVYRKETRILVFSMNAEDLYAKRFLRLGARGYLHKESKPEDIKKAMLTVLEGKIFVSQQMNDRLLEGLKEEPVHNPFEKLSDRELEIVRYFLLGYSVADIKKTLNIHASTVGTYKMRLFEKLNVKNALELSDLAKLYDMNFTGKQA
ncbi:MAG: response regulator transcription factor [Bacteroidetes bacterium]|nr:response regulator transcription factor [Bacteroidota bacterium]